MKLPIPRYPVSPEESRALKAIAEVCFPVGLPAKRFARQMQGASELTEGQRGFLWSIVKKFRRQISDAEIVAMAEKWCSMEKRIK